MHNRQVIEQKIDYIHNNPLSKKWNLVLKQEDYYYLSANLYLNEDKKWDFLTHYVEDV